MEFTAIVEQSEGGWYIGQIKEYPAAISQGATIQELKENLLDALKLLIETNQKTLRLTIQVEEKQDHPDHPFVIDDLKEAIKEIKMAESGKIKLQSAQDLINQL